MSQDSQNQNSTEEEVVVEAQLSEETSDSTSWTISSDQSQEEVTRLREALARSQADYQNLLMRVERDKADMVSFLSAKILLPLLTQIDTLERAIKLKEWTEGDAFVDGIRALYAGFQKYLESQKVTPFDSIGQEVDPDKHDVMTQMAGEEWKILSEFEKWYMIGDRVLRHARVVVGSGE